MLAPLIFMQVSAARRISTAGDASLSHRGGQKCAR